MTGGSARPRLAVDIGGTFTDVALAVDGRDVTAKVLTTPANPEEGVIAGISKVLADTGVAAGDVRSIIHGTTLATNALIERRGAKAALIVTEGHRDSVEMAYENRFEQYDMYADRPPPLVPRYLRWPVRERLNWKGEVLRPLDEDSVTALIPKIGKHAIESLAIGLIHGYANPVHERRVAAILRAALPDLPISLASDVCPEIREYERQSTTCANAYIQPLMARYLIALERRLGDIGLTCPCLLMTSGGCLTMIETAIEYPIRLVESGPAGGAILASRLARECSLDQVVSFDMGGTTAKICLLDDGEPLLSRSLEVARAHRFMKGSGLPIKIPVIEMVEIGAGGGSIVRVDPLDRIIVGPQSAGADPGPACYGRGGARPTVTDADVVLGRVDPRGFAGGSMRLDPDKAEESIAREVGAALSMDATHAAFATSEIVDENMANAARVHAIEWGKEISQRTMIAFGGAAPLHAARVAEKLGIDQVIVPRDAGVGSAIGFLSAPIAFEMVCSRYLRLVHFDPAVANDLYGEMRDEAYRIVRLGAPDTELGEVRKAYMRYVGQGHEISVDLPVRTLQVGDAQTLRDTFEVAYSALFGRVIPNADIEVLSWALRVSSVVPAPEPVPPVAAEAEPPEPGEYRQIFDPATGRRVDAAVYRRFELAPSMRVAGPALVIEDQTTTVVSPEFSATVNARGDIVLDRV